MGVKRAISNAKDSRAKKVALYKSGQNLIGSALCLATFMNGTACNEVRVNAGIPYCKNHMEKGDPSMKVVKHPKFGKMLVAARDLPSRYHIGLFGRFKTKTQMTDSNLNWAFETSSGGFIDPDGLEAQAKYCQCPGPNEIVTVGFSGSPDMIDKKLNMGSMMFMTKMLVPKNYQLVMMYSDSVQASDVFFAERGIVRADVGTQDYPCYYKKTRNAPQSAEGGSIVYPTYKSGQHTVKSGRCIASFSNGKPCYEVAAEACVPYCKEHMRNGDPSLKVVQHPKYGKCLVAARKLPPMYYMALYGDLLPKKKVRDEHMSWCFITDGKGVINPKTRNSQVKFCQCPGPDEVVTVAFAPENKELCAKKAKYGSMIFVTKREIPTNYQLVMLYAEDEKSTSKFFKERGIVRDNVSCPKYRCFLKKKAHSDRT